MKGKLLFQENQRFIFTWSWWLVTLVSAPSAGLMWYQAFRQLSTGEPTGTNPTSDTTLIVVVIITTIIIGGVIWLLSVAELQVKIDRNGIYYQYFPFVRSEKTLSKTDVEELFVRQYSPIWEYGGWGYRIRLSKGKALNVTGDQGLQLILKGDKKLLLGTQKPKEMEKAVKELKANW